MLGMFGILNLPDGTYFIDGEEKILDYAEKWSYGYIVGIKQLTFGDIEPHLLFSIRTVGSTKTYTKVKHVDSREDALSMLNEHGDIWDLRDNEWVSVD